MEELSTYQYAEIIAESWINGLPSQALDQFKRAVWDSCEVKELMQDIDGLLDEEQFRGLAVHLLRNAHW